MSKSDCEEPVSVTKPIGWGPPRPRRREPSGCAVERAARLARRILERPSPAGIKAAEECVDRAWTAVETAYDDVMGDIPHPPLRSTIGVVLQAIRLAGVGASVETITALAGPERDGVVVPIRRT
jgi:hypothetical protein